MHVSGEKGIAEAAALTAAGGGGGGAAPNRNASNAASAEDADLGALEAGRLVARGEGVGAADGLGAWRKAGVNG